MADVLIIGNGPAGISAALYTVRAGIPTRIIGKDYGALDKAEKIENYYGLDNPIAGRDLVIKGIEQAKRLGVSVNQEEVVGIGYDGRFTVRTNMNEYVADSVIIATGSPRSTPKIPGLEQFEGRGVSYCAVCDAFFYRGKNVAVLGCCDYARNEALELLPIAKSVSLISNGVAPSVPFPDEVTINTRKITSFEGDDRVRRVEFDDGTALDVEGVFVAYGSAGSADLARKLGVETNGNKIAVDESMATNIPGLFAAGDCTGGMLQIAKAVYQGAAAGSAAVKYIRSLK